MKKTAHDAERNTLRSYTKHEVAEEYDRVRFEPPLGKFLNLCETSALLKAIDQLDAKRVADVACGTARFSFLMQELEYSVVGIDVSKAMLNVAKNKGRITLVHASAFSLPFRNDVFDIVISFRFLWHLKQHVAPLKELKRIGKYIIVDVKHTMKKKSISPPGHRVYEHFFSTNELLTDFYSAGLTIKQIIPIQMVPSRFVTRKTRFFNQFWAKLNLLLRKAPFTFLSPHWLVVAR